MTERLYYHDAYVTKFTATVVDVRDDARCVYLDRSAFYPTSGGQPHDVGTLNGVMVVDVVDEDDRVAHVLGAATTFVVGTRLEGAVQWPRRFDFMQQHTGQHLLSAMFADDYSWHTTSVHFGDETSSLDLTAASITSDELRDAEQRANTLVTENRDVVVTFEDAATAAGLRKASDREGTLRIVNIRDLDRSACGGTHVRRTGEIGSIQLRSAERAKGGMRVEFLCGLRAVRRARLDAALLTSAARTFTASTADVPALVTQLHERAGELDRERKRLVAELSGYDARERWEHAVPNASGVRRFHLAHTSAVRDMEPLAQSLAALGPCIVLVTSTSPAGALFAVGDGAGVDAGQQLRAALAAVGGRGGGSPRLAQGSVPDATRLHEVVSALGFSASDTPPSVPPGPRTHGGAAHRT